MLRNLFRTNNSSDIYVGDVYEVQIEDQTVIITVISIDEVRGGKAISITGKDKDTDKIIFGHLPFTEEAFKDSVGEKARKVEVLDFDMEGYNLWMEEVKKGKAGAFPFPLQKVMESLPKPMLTFMRLDDTSKIDYRLTKHKGVTILGIFRNDQELGSIAPYTSDAHLPSLPLTINESKFHKISEVIFNGESINIGYYDFSEQLDSTYTFEMIGFQGENLSYKTYETIRRLRLIPCQMLLNILETKKIGVNDVKIYFDPEEKFWNFMVDYPDAQDPVLKASKSEGTELIQKYLEAINQFKEKFDVKML